MPNKCKTEEVRASTFMVFGFKITLIHSLRVCCVLYVHSRLCLVILMREIHLGYSCKRPRWLWITGDGVVDRQCFFFFFFKNWKSYSHLLPSRFNKQHNKTQTISYGPFIYIRTYFKLVYMFTLKKKCVCRQPSNSPPSIIPHHSFQPEIYYRLFLIFIVIGR